MRILLASSQVLHPISRECSDRWDYFGHYMWVTKQLTQIKTHCCQVDGSRWFLHSRHWHPEKYDCYQFLGVLNVTSVVMLPSHPDCTRRNCGICSTCLPYSFPFSSFTCLIHIRILIKKPTQTALLHWSLHTLCSPLSTQARQFICYSNKSD